MGQVSVNTSRFSEIQVDEDRILCFPEGIIGFEAFKRFALIAQGDSPFMWLQSVEEPSLAFLVTDPANYCQSYRPDFDEDVVKCLGASSPDEVGYLAIAAVPPDPSKATLNLRAPIAVNKRKRIGRQIVATDPAFLIKYRIFAR